MPSTSSNRSAAVVLAIAGSLVVAILFLASAAGVGMGSRYKIGMLRLTPSTIAIALLPVPALAAITAFWSRLVSSGSGKVLRIVMTVVLLVVAVASASLTILIVFLEPVQRGGVP